MERKVKLEREIKSEYEPPIESQKLDFNTTNNASRIHQTIPDIRESISYSILGNSNINFIGDPVTEEYIPISAIAKQELNSIDKWAKVEEHKLSSINLRYENTTTSTQFEFVSVETKYKQMYDDNRTENKCLRNNASARNSNRERQNTVNNTVYKERFKKEMLDETENLTIDKQKKMHAESNEAYWERQRARNAANNRAYRARLKLTKMMDEQTKKHGESAESYRERQKARNAAKARAYRERLKLKKIELQNLMIDEQNRRNEEQNFSRNEIVQSENQIHTNFKEQEEIHNTYRERQRARNAANSKAYRERLRLKKIEIRKIIVDEHRRRSAEGFIDQQDVDYNETEQPDSDSRRGKQKKMYAENNVARKERQRARNAANNRVYRARLKLKKTELRNMMIEEQKRKSTENFNDILPSVTKQKQPHNKLTSNFAPNLKTVEQEKREQQKAKNVAKTNTYMERPKLKKIEKQNLITDQQNKRNENNYNNQQEVNYNIVPLVFKHEQPDDQITLNFECTTPNILGIFAPNLKTDNQEKKHLENNDNAYREEQNIDSIDLIEDVQIQSTNFSDRQDMNNKRTVPLITKHKLPDDQVVNSNYEESIIAYIERQRARNAAKNRAYRARLKMKKMELRNLMAEEKRKSLSEQQQVIKDDQPGVMYGELAAFTQNLKNDKEAESNQSYRERQKARNAAKNRAYRARLKLKKIEKQNLKMDEQNKINVESFCDQKCDSYIENVQDQPDKQVAALQPDDELLNKNYPSLASLLLGQKMGGTPLEMVALVRSEDTRASEEREAEPGKLKPDREIVYRREKYETSSAIDPLCVTITKEPVCDGELSLSFFVPDYQDEQ